MSYCTRQDMIDRYGETELIQLTDANNLGIIDDVKLNNAITDATEEINGYLGRYQLPLSTVPGILVRVCCDIARFFLYDDGMPEHVQDRYDHVIEYLESVAEGKVSLGVNTEGQSPESNDSAVMTSGGRTFDRKDISFI